MILEIFSNLNDSMILLYSCIKTPAGRAELYIVLCVYWLEPSALFLFRPTSDGGLKYIFL